MTDSKFKPDRDNREECLRRLRADLAACCESMALPEFGANFAHLPRDRWYASTVVAAEQRWKWALLADAVGIQVDGLDPSAALNAYLMCLNAETHLSVDGVNAWSAPHEEFKEAPWLLGVLAGNGRSDLYSAYSAYFLKVHSAGGSRRAIWTDEPFFGFFVELLRAEVSGHWPAAAARSAPGKYEALISLAPPGGDAWSTALVDACDHRMAHAWRYDGIEATKRYSSSTTKSIFQDRNFAAVLRPYELFYLASIFERIYGRRIELSAGHPMLAEENLRSIEIDFSAKDAFCEAVSDFLEQQGDVEWRHPAAVVVD